MITRFFPTKLLAVAGALTVGIAPAALAQRATVLADAHEGMVEGAVEEVEETAQETTEELVPQANIAEIVAGVNEFSTLEAALEAAELTDALAGEGPFTVFAPPNEAFDALPDGVVEALLMPENKDLLTEVLTYHVVSGEVMSTDLESGMVETLSGEEITVDLGDTVMIDDAEVVAVDLPATNGVIHIIDGVLVPATVATELEARLAAAEEEPMMEEEVMVEEEPMMVEEEPMMEEPAPAEPVRGLW
jgi:uncharacterized surface protein with fasciclin (FAS1) repeats